MDSVTIHFIQHVPFEDPAYLFSWAHQRNYRMTGTHVYRSFSFPDIHAFDALMIMGGPMGVYDTQHSWITREKHWIGSVIASGKPVLGICLGAQMIADVLGARVFRNKHREIGWFPVHATDPGKQSSLLAGLPEEMTAFHWHGDTFDLPQGAVHLLESDAAAYQAFSAGSVLGLQFHLEITRESITRLIEHCEDDLKPGPYVQDRKAIMQNAGRLPQILNTYCRTLMDHWIQPASTNFSDRMNT